MKARFFLLTLILILSVFGSWANATPIDVSDFSSNAVILDFEELGIDDVVSNQYTSLGVQFNNVPVWNESEGAPFTFYGSASDIATSGSNYLSQFGPTDNSGLIIITFSNAVTKVGLYAIDPSELDLFTQFTAYFTDGGSETIDIPPSSATFDPAPFVGVMHLGGISSVQIAAAPGDP